MAGLRIVRFYAAERIAHWLSALSFLYAALSGLSLWSQKFFWLSAIFGGGEAVRRWHPWGGVIFALMLGVMFQKWAREMKLDADDKRWLKAAHRYAVHEEEGLPEPGKFNGGQKLLFWTQSLAALLLLASGVVMWFPEAMPRALTLSALLIHPIAAIVSIGGIIVHIYMGTLAVPGALRSMTQGWVTERWAAAHHPKWHRAISKR